MVFKAYYTALEFVQRPPKAWFTGCTYGILNIVSKSELTLSLLADSMLKTNIEET